MPRPSPRSVPAGEWVGGCALAPFYVAEGEVPQRVAVALWLELPADKLVGQQMTGSDTDPSQLLATSLRECLRKPATGKPRRPAALRVEREVFAAALREVVGDDIPVRVGPVPELDLLFESLFSHLDSAPAEAGREPFSYLASGRVQPQSVEKLFDAARHFQRLKPWQRLGDDPILRVDIPKFGLEAACAQILGLHGTERGFALFPSLAHYERFRAACDDVDRSQAASPSIGTPMRLFTLERGADLPPAMRKEAAVHGWKLDDAESYPLVLHSDEHSIPRPLVDLDVQIMASAALAIGTFAMQVGKQPQRKGASPVSMSYENPDGVTVRVTYPYESHDQFEPARPRQGRGKSKPKLEGKHWSDVEAMLGRRERSLTWGIGVLTAAGTHPSMRVLPSQWLPLLLGESEFENEKQARTIMGSIMISYNEVVAALDKGRILLPGGELEAIRDWCDGYCRGLLLDTAWQRDRTALEILEPVFDFARPDLDEQELVEAVVEAHLHFRELRMAEHAAAGSAKRPSAPRIVSPSAARKPGRNEPCPCGSGKKYKQCCLRAES